MLTRQTLFGSRDDRATRPSDALAPQVKPNPAQPTAPAIDSVRGASERSAQAVAERAHAEGLRSTIATAERSVVGQAERSGSAPGPAAPPAVASASNEIPATQKVPVPPLDRAIAGAEARMVVGPNIKMKSVEINDCDTLIVEGSVEATMDARQIEIAPTGAYTGKASVDNAEIHGLFTGELTVRRRLVIHATGKVGGTLRYGKMIIEEGGEIAGDVKSLAGNAGAELPRHLRPTSAGIGANSPGIGGADLR